jgi:hypothetical protein
MSRVANELLQASLTGEADILSLIGSKKTAKTTAKEFERFRRQLSKRLQS